MLRTAGGTAGSRGNSAGQEGQLSPLPLFPLLLLFRGQQAVLPSSGSHLAAPRSSGEWIRKGLYFSGR